MIYLELAGQRLYEFNFLKSWLHSQSIPYEAISIKDITSGNIKIQKGDIADGTIPFIYAILKQKCRPIPIIDSYPNELSKFMRRMVRKTKLRYVPENYTGFIKPAYDLKRFTGFEMQYGDLIWKLHGLSKNLVVYLSQPVKFISEWRYYVINGKIEACGHYDGGESIRCDPSVVGYAVDLIKHKQGTFCIDFGVLDDGQTALVEYNDAFSVGWYLDDKPDIYFNMIQTRFRELLGWDSRMIPNHA